MLSDCTWGGGKPKLDRILNGAFLLDFQACGDPGQTMDAGYLRITATLLSYVNSAARIQHVLHELCVRKRSMSQACWVSMSRAATRRAAQAFQMHSPCCV